MNLKNYYEKGIRYDAYHHYLQALLAQGKTTGDDHSPGMLEYAKLGLSRMKKWNKRYSVPDDLHIFENGDNIGALAISEGWCGDAAQNLPAIEKITDVNGIEMHIVLRDENTELIDQYLTNGGRSIPIVIFFELNTGKELAVWGPRPMPAQEILREHKNRIKYDSHAFHQDLHHWYAVDKHKTLSTEMKSLLEGLK